MPTCRPQWTAAQRCTNPAAIAADELTDHGRRGTVADIALLLIAVSPGCAAASREYQLRHAVRN